MNGNRPSDVESTHAQNTLAVHVLVFKASQRNWAGYNRYLAECIAEFVRLFLEVNQVETDIYCSTISPVSPKLATDPDMTIASNLQAVKS